MLDMFSQSLLAAGDATSSAERIAAAMKSDQESKPKPKYKKLGAPPEPVPQPVLPLSCYIKLNKQIRIEKMLGKYYLSWHPFPKLFGELLIFKTQKADKQEDKESIVYRDYSLCNRLSPGPPVQKSLKKKTRALPGRKSAVDDIPEPEVELIPKLQTM